MSNIVRKERYNILCSHERLFACEHVLKVHFAFCQFVLAYDSYKWYLFCIGIAHLLLHLRLIWVYLRTEACGAHLRENLKAEVCFSLAKINEEHLCGIDSLLWIKVKLVEHVKNTVSTKRDSHTTEAREAKDASEVIVTSTTCDRTNLHIKSLDLKNGTRVIVQSASECEVKLDSIVEI